MHDALMAPTIRKTMKQIVITVKIWNAKSLKIYLKDQAIKNTSRIINIILCMYTRSTSPINLAFHLYFKGSMLFVHYLYKKLCSSIPAKYGCGHSPNVMEERTDEQERVKHESRESRESRERKLMVSCTWMKWSLYMHTLWFISERIDKYIGDEMSNFLPWVKVVTTV